MKLLYLAFILPSLLFSLPGFAEQRSLIEPKTQGDVEFVSGGVGADERDAMQAMLDDYNLNLLFSISTGEYLSDVKVRISDAKDSIVLDAVSDGPELFAKLKPGRYRVTADSNGQVIHKMVKVGDKPMAALSFVWPDGQEN